MAGKARHFRKWSSSAWRRSRSETIFCFWLLSSWGQRLCQAGKCQNGCPHCGFQGCYIRHSCRNPIPRGQSSLEVAKGCNPALR